jgi:hypothetical protein
MRVWSLALPLVLAPAWAQAAPEMLEVPAPLRVDPAGAPLDEAQRQALWERKVLAALVKDNGPEPWPGVAVALLDGSPRQVFTVLRDYPHFAEFMPYVQSATIVEHVGKRWLVDYVIKGPMGIGNRQYQLEVFDEEETVDGVSVLVSRFRYTGKGDIKSTQGSWKLVPLRDGKTTFARYEVRTDPGGRFTAWLKRKIAANGLPKVIEAVRKRLAASKGAR